MLFVIFTFVLVSKKSVLINGTLKFVNYDEQYLNKWRNSYWQTPTKKNIALFDMEKDPFELNNLAFNPNYAKAMAKTREWAETEIGRPPIAVVGGWNEAYVKMLKSYAATKKEIDQSYDYFWKSGRAIPYEVCETENDCTSTWLPITGWSESGTIEYDFSLLDEKIATLKDKIKNGTSYDSQKSRRVLERFWLWARLCGNLCCPLLKRKEIELLYHVELNHSCINYKNLNAISPKGMENGVA